MKILALQGSPRLRGNTAILLSQFVNGARAAGGDVEVVNLQEQGVSAHIIMKGMCGSRLQGTVYTMQADLAAENDFAEPERVAPQEAVFCKENDSFMYEFPKFSLTVFRLKEI